ncbi:TlpA family protein disulfide reductase [Gaetbulibacter sp. NE]|uniref:TlpA family protein disulfide reductase n=1 Tax=Gaetbulibacter sp. NE TaxID=2982307 RepID=UPI0021D1972E|nr:TlpA disulfide reductase family protein [Gaetbulibacter sp. NE]
MDILLYKKVLIFSICLNVCFTLNAQISVSEVMQESTIATHDNNKLYYVDFWATWCGPCIHAKKHLTVIQKLFPNDLHVISISEESPVRIEQFLERNNTKLTIVRDYYGETFDAFKIKSLPVGMLFDTKGKKLWEGHPGDLNASLINRFLRTSSKVSSLHDFVNVIVEVEDDMADYMPAKSIEINPLKSSSSEFLIIDNKNYLELNGDLLDIVSYLSRIYKKQIVIDNDLNSSYQIYIKKPVANKADIAITLLEQLDYSIEINETTNQVFSLKLDNPNFWDTNQINWGNNNNHYLISDTDITADNVSLKDLTYELSRVLETPVVILDEDEQSLKIHDWQIHYKYFEFMYNNFLDYGISIKKEKINYPVYSITKKAP